MAKFLTKPISASKGALIIQATKYFKKKPIKKVKTKSTGKIKKFPKTEKNPKYKPIDIPEKPNLPYRGKLEEDDMKDLLKD